MSETPTQYQLESEWITAEGIPGVRYRFSDIVRIKSGEYLGQPAEVITLLSIDPEPAFGVVQPFVLFPQHDLESAGTTAGRKLILHKPGEKPGVL